MKTAVSGSNLYILNSFATYIPEEPDAITLVLLNSGVQCLCFINKIKKKPKHHILPQKVYSLNLGSAQCTTTESRQRMPSKPYSYGSLGDGQNLGSTTGRRWLQTLFSNPQSNSVGQSRKLLGIIAHAAHAKLLVDSFIKTTANLEKKKRQKDRFDEEKLYYLAKIAGVCVCVHINETCSIVR